MIKCAICGGELNFSDGSSVATCSYCGSNQPIPNLDSEKKTDLYDLADHHRRNNDFDKAKEIYEKILQEDITDSVAYWSIILCDYGITYVDDPRTGKKVLTVNRTQKKNVVFDENYKSAIKYSDEAQKKLYEEEARKIDEVQKKILDICLKEEPFDVFICYKETDDAGRRTLDSTIANELYRKLEKQNLKVFYSRVTLEDKLGIDYEPYIFAAIQSAKVMIVLGTRPEYFESPWVKNEWQRFLGLKQKGANKTIIPVYNSIDPEDLPSEFVQIQAQDIADEQYQDKLVERVDTLVLSDMNVFAKTKRKFKSFGESMKRNKVKIIVSAIISLLVLVLVGLSVLFINEKFFSKDSKKESKVLDIKEDVEETEKPVNEEEEPEITTEDKSEVTIEETEPEVTTEETEPEITTEETEPEITTEETEPEIVTEAPVETEPEVIETTTEAAVETTAEPTVTALDVGTIVQMGRYKEVALEWEVLYSDNGIALVICTTSVSKQQYYNTVARVTWEVSTLRQWLNEDFYDRAFSAEEQEKILTATITNDDNIEYNVDGGNDTEDKVFLLSIYEAEDLFNGDFDRKTDYSWALRSPGKSGNYYAYVDSNGKVNYSGEWLLDSLDIRPVMWIYIN